MYETTLDISGWEFNIRVHYEFFPRYKATLIDPEEPAYIEIDRVEYEENGKWWPLEAPEVVFTEISEDILLEHTG